MQWTARLCAGDSGMGNRRFFLASDALIYYNKVSLEQSLSGGGLR